MARRPAATAARKGQTHSGGPCFPQALEHGPGHRRRPRRGPRLRLPPGQEVKELRAGVPEGVGNPRRNQHQGPAPGQFPFRQPPWLRFPGQDAPAVKGVEPLPVGRVQVVASHLPRPDGDQVKGLDYFLGIQAPLFPGKEAEPPLVFFDFSLKVQEFHFRQFGLPLAGISGRVSEPPPGARDFNRLRPCIFPLI